MKSAETLKQERLAHEELKKLRPYNQLTNAEKTVYIAMLIGGASIKFIKKSIKEARNEQTVVVKSC
jgi:chemotaxis response regulator CheB